MKKNNIFKSMVFSLLLAILINMTLATPVFATTYRLDKQIEKTAKYLLEKVKEPTISSVGGEWLILGLARSDLDLPQKYWDDYYSRVEKEVISKKGFLSENKNTEYSRLIIALTAIGARPEDVGGYNLLTPLADYEKTVWQGINGPIWALIALDSGNYQIPPNSDAKILASRQMYIEYILSHQHPDGGWSLAGKSDPDITGMALQALSKYKNQDKVNKAIAKGLDWISKNQTALAGFSSYGNDNLESSVQILLALNELDIPLDDNRFVKNNTNLLDNIMTYLNKDGSFKHIISDKEANQISTEQAFYALVSSYRYKENKSSLYTMDDVKIKPTKVAANTNKINKPIINPNIKFSDIKNHPNKDAIESLAKRAIILGKSPDFFDPDASMTRAEFATIITRALDLKTKNIQVFEDVKKDNWAFTYISAAYSNGIIKGVGKNNFNPKGKITKEEAITMLSRAANICGIKNDLKDQEIRNILTQFSDSSNLSTWARKPMAFCYKENILPNYETRINPKKIITRAEVSQILYNMLIRASIITK